MQLIALPLLLPMSPDLHPAVHANLQSVAVPLSMRLPGFIEILLCLASGTTLCKTPASNRG
ncbi:hypothetical protein, partial [Xanthomonas oryzae]|uniref:hypothetical protein n=1 Tax=Xanthomonas oryzae TaxID=347 RepID=UPI001CA58BFA